MELSNNSDHIFTLEKAAAVAAALNGDVDGFTYQVVVLPNGMEKVSVHDEVGEFVEYW
jgi:hypothetical protein